MRSTPLLTMTLAVFVAACATAEPEIVTPAPEPVPAATATPERPLPYPVVLPPEFERAVEAGTRSRDGAPGPRYWRQEADYAITARVDVDAKTLTGSETIRYHNNSPDTLPVLVLNVIQNFHAEGAIRMEAAEVTGGVEIERVSINGRELGPSTGQTPGFAVEGTLMYILLPRAVAPGRVVDVGVDWSFPIPRAGAGERMGYSGEELLYLGYWFPQMAVYDDVIGWHVEPFRGNAEFYSDFGDYDVTVDAPEGWLVMSTGRLENAEAVLRPEVLERLRRAESSDEVVHVLTHEDAATATMAGRDGRLTWRFAAERVRDAAFAVMREYAWDAARTPVGDRDGDGVADYARVDAFWREYARYWDDAARYAQHSIDFLSRFTGQPYPWPHMSVIEGGGIIGGGMEFPMMTLIGDYNTAGDSALYNVVAHELAHMWQPMMLSSNERRYAWFDEGMTTFNENNARMEFFPGPNHYLGDQRTYMQVARAGLEGPIMRWSDHHRPGPAYGIASYAKPGSVLHALRGVLGEATFERALQAYFDRWAFRHPYPWDMFNTFEDVSGQDLDWFWRAWYYESTQDGRWFLDQAVAGVERLPSGETRITIRDEGWVPMPVVLQVTREGGEVVNRTIPVDQWLEGAATTTVTLPAGAVVIRVEIDPEEHFPDVDRSDNVWHGR
ncbi:MAG TPA: M1 family metallopeptidase [Longimicrobiales bacterium]|nr:M1 family metallopeptidase [Longimicrobiales bacterium]